MRALLTNYHQSPRKVRLVADLIRGKTVPQARVALSFLMQKSSGAFSKLLESAVANSRNSGISPEGLMVKHVSVDKGAVARRARPFGRGRSGTLRKTYSIIKIELAPASAKGAKKRKIRNSKSEKI
ncbi:MAG: 50S ribosomal protein L22 [bacterium]|nr:50S ribosomal protein L22 [bacterium]